MTTTFPTGLDTLTNPAPTDPRTSPSHAAQHADANDAIEALEAKVGVNGSAVTTSDDYKLARTMRLLARKTANESVNNSGTGVTLQNDDHLLFALLANDIYLLQVLLFHSGGATGAPNIKIAFTVPSGGAILLSTVGLNASGTLSQRRWVASGVAQDMLSPASANPETTMVFGRVINGANAGNFQVQWAQDTSSSENETVYAHSSIFGMKV